MPNYLVLSLLPQVAIDGISVVTLAGGAAATCIEGLGGLTLDQLRWIFSNYTSEMLEGTGWDPTSLVSSDGDDTTHLWSELSADCPAIEIKIAGHGSGSGTYDYIAETIFSDMDNGESFDLNRPDGYFNSLADSDIIDFLTTNEDAIGYVGYAYYQENQDAVSVAAIENADGAFVAPDATTVADGSYNPLSRRIFMNLLNDADALAFTVPFVQYGLGPAGSALVSAVGYVPIPEPSMEIAVAKSGSV
jgi:phosphate transport system substrate-binding protein